MSAFFAFLHHVAALADGQLGIEESYIAPGEPEKLAASARCPERHRDVRGPLARQRVGHRPRLQVRQA